MDGHMEFLRNIVDSNDSRPSKVFDLTIQALIVISLIAFAVDTLPDVSPTVRQCLRYLEVITVAIFTVEYMLRILVAPDRIRFIFSFYGIVDLMAIAPFYLVPGLDLRSARVFRMLRLIRILKLARYSVALRRMHRALLIAKEELVLFFLVTISLLYFAAVGIYSFENDAQPEAFQSVFHSLWWAVTTLTTVGYGDIYPVTVGGRIFTFMILLIGLGVVSVPAGIFASALSRARKIED